MISLFILLAVLETPFVVDGLSQSGQRAVQLQKEKLVSRSNFVTSSTILTLNIFIPQQAQASVIDDEFKLADTDRNGKLTKNEFTSWYKGNELLNEPPPIGFPIIAFDLSAIAIGLAGVYAAAYTWYITQMNADAEAMARKQAEKANKRGAKEEAADSSEE